ncbi:nitrite reductase large subunit NirB [Acidithiobacillus sp.]|jgi:nitrite reductase (NADH) large subunit|uniref:nitrite reductase large subunit NirB n=1 Tax=Acidithiobacillus sp. TaxID=1872118 RepID=UPI00261D5A8A|nr:nitrite reductase large subunit NirB [Acidithiobacillus sp.]
MINLVPVPVQHRKARLVVVGNGMAGIRTVEELLKMAPDLYEITVFGDEPHPNYNRILLTPVLAGEMALEETILNPLGWYAEHGITLHTGSRVTVIDRVKRRVVTEDGRTAPYDRLLLATGAAAAIAPIPGNNLLGVLSYRDMADVESLTRSSELGGEAVVIGGGLLGLEVAHGLRARGMGVTVVHRRAWPLDKQLDARGGALLQAALEARGVRFLLGKESAAVLGDTHVRGLRFTDGGEIPADVLVMTIGIKPRIEIALAAGLQCETGILVNDTLQTYDPRIYAVGECVQHRGQTYGLVAPLFEQAKVAANHLAEYGRMRYQGSVTSTKLKVTGIELFSAGDFMGGDDCEEVTLLDGSQGIYKKVILRENKVVGSLLYGDTSIGPWLFQLMRDGTEVSAFRDNIVFGETHLGDSGHAGENQASRLADGAEVCGCNGVTKGSIVKAIREQGLFTLEEVRKCTKASASCGSCTGLVEQLLASTLGGIYDSTPKKKALCGCTDLSHQEIRDAIIQEKLLSVRQTFVYLDWRHPGGCATCRPAINYYVRTAWPAEGLDDAQSRFINERAHANIQKDGTYSVIPRIYGGVTSPAELKRIAEVAERHNVAMVKFTGGQRLDLLGVKKEDLPQIWAELDMPSGHAYGKALRTVKSCVGTDFCRFGVQDSTRLAIELERGLERMWAPHKVKLAVSGCPRNCSESTIKDFGIIGVDSGWELYVGGNGGMKVRAADLLCKVKTHEEVLVMAKAFLQMYREDAQYLERTAPWVERVGLDHIKAIVVGDQESRQQLAARMDFALSQEKDPWAEAVSGRLNIHAAPLRRVPA